jgi:hypothetical protein
MASIGAFEPARAHAARRGCRIKPFRKTRSTFAEMHFRGAVHDALATNHLGATDDMAVLGTHPDKPSSAPARGFPDSHHAMQQST